MRILLACKVPRNKFLRNISPWFPGGIIFSGRLDEELQCAVLFPAVLKQAVDQPCSDVEIFRGKVCQGDSVPMDFWFGDGCGHRCDAVDREVFDEGVTLDECG